jgi:hypothetical protein
MIARLQEFSLQARLQGFDPRLLEIGGWRAAAVLSGILLF